MSELDDLPEKGTCIDPVAKVQVRNTLISWFNKRNEDIAKMRKSKQIDPAWIDNYATVLDAVKKEIDRLEETPDCVEEPEKAEPKPEGAEKTEVK